MMKIAALSLLVSAVLPAAGHAQTLSVTGLAAIRQYVSAPPSSFFGPAGPTLYISATVTDVDGTYDNDGVFALPAATIPPNGGGFYSAPMMSEPAFHGSHAWSAYVPINYSNPWTVQFGDVGGLSLPYQTPAEITGAPVPYASNITISGDPNHPTFGWTHAANPTQGGSFFVIYDGELEVFGAANPVGAVQYTLPPASAGGFDLVTGHEYTILIAAYILRPGDPTLCGNSCLAADSDNYFGYTPLPATLPQLHVLEPAFNDPNAVHLHFAVNDTATYHSFAEADTTSGFAYRSVSGPVFAEVGVPAGQTSDFTVSYISGGKSVSRSVKPGGAIKFPGSGVSVFVVNGIDQPAPVGFVTRLKFTGTGLFAGEQAPLTSNLPGAGNLAPAR